MQCCLYWFQFGCILRTNNNNDISNNQKLFHFCSGNINRRRTNERVTLCYCCVFCRFFFVIQSNSVWPNRFLEVLFQCVNFLFCGGECTRIWRHCAMSILPYMYIMYSVRIGVSHTIIMPIVFNFP